MAVETVTLSDLGTSLLEIEKEINENNSTIDYYKKQASKLRDRNDALVKLSQSLCKLNIPVTYHYDCKDLY